MLSAKSAPQQSQLMILSLPRRFSPSKVGYAVGGSGTLLKSEDNGQTWKRDRSTDGIAGNLYEIKFTDSGTGFILGNDGILLRYIAA